MARIFKLYRHFDAFGELLYVGISTNIASRLSNHRSGSHWFERVTTIKIETYENIEELRAVEKRVIEHEKPTFNFIFNAANKKDKPTDLLNIAELANYLCVPQGRIRRDVCLKRFPIPTETQNPFTWLKSEIDSLILNEPTKSHIEKMRLK